MAGSPKTRRQATACDWCRLHKVKCDTEQPSCRNCVRRGIACVTVNLRQPSDEGRRLVPAGRRSARKSRTSTRPRTPVNIRSGEDIDGGTSETSRYPPSPPPHPLLRTFEARSPETVLPAIFATPFDSETVDECVTSEKPISGTLPSSTEQVRDGTTVTLVTDKSSFRRQAVGSGSSQYVLVQWLDLFFARSPAWTPIFPFLQQGLAYSLDMPLPFTATLPSLPSDETARRLTDLFFSRIYPIFPVIGLEPFQQSIIDLGHKVDQPEALETQDFPKLACIYAVFSAAADEEAGNISADGTRYLQAAYSLYSQLVATPYMASAQALLLLTLLLRNRNKDGASWGTLSQAICIAQSLGLHRHVACSTAVGPQTSSRHPYSPDCSPASGPTDGDHAARVWWVAYTLERTMALETGRPSLIHDEECDQIMPRKSAATTVRSCSFDYFHALISLARLKARAINLLYGSKSQPKSVRALLVEMGQIDRALVDWADSVPESIRPGRDLFCGADELRLATYMSMHYYQTMIALHRPALMSAPGFLRNRINKYCSGTPWHDRLHFSLCIGVASARSMLKAMNDLKMYAGTSRIITVNQIFVAILVLGIYSTKVPISLMNNSDLALLSTFSEQIEDEYIQMGQDPEFAKGLKILRQQLHEYNSSLRPDPTTSSGAREVSVLPQGLSYDSSLGDLDRSIEVDDLEESWSYLWNDDFSAYLSHNVDQDMTNMYLLGLPQSWA